MSWGINFERELKLGEETAVTHKMSPEEVRRTGAEGSKRPPGNNNPGEVLHQRASCPSAQLLWQLLGSGSPLL